MSKLTHRRILLKLSGEALMGDEDYGIDPKVIHRLAAEVMEAQQAGAEIALVVGGGNIFRGAGLAAGGMDRVTGDHMGMLATVMNGIAMRDALEGVKDLAASQGVFNMSPTDHAGFDERSRVIVKVQGGKWVYQPDL